MKTLFCSDPISTRPEDRGILGEKPPVKTYLTTGTIHDTLEGAEKMQNILNKNICTFPYKEVHQGHSWATGKPLLTVCTFTFSRPTD
jgi:hypothetical protein